MRGSDTGRLDAEFQYAANLARQLISQAHASATATFSHDDSQDQLERLAALKQKGILSEQEFQAKKRQLLGLYYGFRLDRWCSPPFSLGEAAHGRDVRYCFGRTEHTSAGVGRVLP